MSQSDYIIIPGSNKRVYSGSIVMLYRLPGTKWIIHNGYYTYSGRKMKGWYFSSIPSETVMPVFNEDLVAMKVISDVQPTPPCPPGPKPPEPPGPPTPPAPEPTIYTPEDKETVARSMITVDTLEQRDKLSSDDLIDGKIVRVNDVDGKVQIYEWDKENSAWIIAKLGDEFMTREEIEQAISSGFVNASFADETGYITFTKEDESEVNILLAGVSHDPVYVADELKITVPVYGHDDLVIDLPGDKYLKGARFEDDYVFPDGSHGPALVFTMHDKDGDYEFATGAASMVNIYTGGETSSAKVTVETSGSNKISADVKISEEDANGLAVKEDGLYVDISGKIDKQDIDAGYVLVADGSGSFAKAVDGVYVVNSGTLSDYTNKHLVTADIIAAAIETAVAALSTTIDQKIDELSSKIDSVNSNLTSKIDSVDNSLTSRIVALESSQIGEGDAAEIVVSTESGVVRSSTYIGGSILDPFATVTNLATEAAVIDAVSWKDNQN